MTYINGYKFRVGAKIGVYTVGAILMSVIFFNILAFNELKNDPNIEIIYILFIASILICLLAAIYEVLITIRDFTKPILTLQAPITFKGVLPWSIFFPRAKNDYIIRVEGEKSGFNVTPEIYNAFSQDQMVEVTYLPVSKILVSIRSI